MNHRVILHFSRAFANESLKNKPYLFACPHVTTREPLHIFSQNLILGGFTNMSTHFNSGKDRTTITDTLHEDLHAPLRVVCSNCVRNPHIGNFRVGNPLWGILLGNPCVGNSRSFTGSKIKR